MSDFRPSAAADEGVLRLRLLDSSPTSSLEIDCVVDLTDFDEVVGIEVLDLTTQLLGGTIEPPRQDSTIRLSYDREMDALYLHVADGRGHVQRRSTARAQLDSGGRLVRLDVRLEPGPGGESARP